MGAREWEVIPVRLNRREMEEEGMGGGDLIQ